ncbi:uncharacterized protein TRIADDRAFT_53407 [Trichoplax adhaerens]|uniref:Uncharacterized protein n=1 Tax=Trichoplax adhaerens TaxID=10228 RepID=B3RP52_TRIAD|nr:hypothetical protein TRIADDRAFT_53407 [Trichoplax adhaerens]EDV28131.1 hypothetical protein TRIADDRAFT_53407 [Trichoplax adhaerens]|eukprot:XP_002109965.1 hypothetical protein TRIADDRAFT_53407 [Trichoplax adhaerens]
MDQHSPIEMSALGQSFRCDKCGSPYVVDPNRRGNRKKKSKHMACPRRKLDPQTNKILTLCNACGLAFSRSKKAKPNPSPPSLEMKLEYLKEAKQFTSRLIEKFGDQDAERLSCPNFKKHGCGCLQKYITDQSQNESETRVRQLLHLIKQAKILRQQKCYGFPNSNGININSTKSKIKVGLGNGHRKSKAFEEFVLTQRKILREEYNLCERATQKILIYSNNFLHKKLKTDPNQRSRITRRKGKAALGKLKPIQDLANENCCIDNCIKIAKTHAKLLEEWRERATSGQEEARRVLAEMLTPAGGSRTNCYRFISWITGCSHSTISRVNEQMKKTGGSREPPQHGLKQWWRKHGQPRKSCKPQERSEQMVDKTTKSVNYSQSFYQQNLYSSPPITKTESFSSCSQHPQAIADPSQLVDTSQYEQDNQKLMEINSQWNSFRSQQNNNVNSRNHCHNTQVMPNMTTNAAVYNILPSDQYNDQQFTLNDSTQLLHSATENNNPQYSY